MANRYWVPNGTGNWSSTTNWSTTSGGASGASVPGATDVAIFDDKSSSAGVNFTATVDTTVTVSAVSTPAIKSTVTISSAGNLTAGTLTINTAYVTSTAGIKFSGNPTFTGAITVTDGVLDVNGQTITCLTCASNGGGGTDHTIAFGTGGTIKVTGNAATVWNVLSTGTSTITGTGTVECTYSGATGTRTIVNTPDTGAANASFKISAGTDTVTFTSNDTVGGIDFTGFSGSWSNVLLNISGSLTLSTGMTVTAGTNAITFNGTGTITSNGKTIDFPFAINGSGITTTIGDATTVGSTRTVTLTNGTLSLSANLTTGLFASNNSNTRSIAFGTNKISLTGSGATIWEGSTLTNFSYTGTPLVECTYSGGTGTRTIANGPTAGLTESNAVSFSITAGTDTISANGGVKNYNTTGFSGTSGLFAGGTIYGNLTLSATTTISANATATTFGATSGTQTITTNGVTIDRPITVNASGATVQLVDNFTSGSTRTFTLTAGTLDLGTNNKTLTTGLFASSNSNTRVITFGTTGKIVLTGSGATIWTASTLTNFSYTGTSLVECTYSGATGTRQIDHGQTAGATESNAVNFSITAGTDTFTPFAIFNCKNLNFTGFAGTWSNVASNIYGNLTVSTGMTATAGINALTFAATSGTKTITTNGKTLDFPLVFNGVGGTFQPQDALTQGSTRSMTLTNGTIDLNGKTVTSGSTFATAAGIKNITFNAGTLTCPGSGATAFNNAAPTNFTTTAGTGTGSISMTNASAKTFVGGGSTYNCSLNQGGAGALTITGSNTFNDITNTYSATGATTITFTSGTTTTVSAFSASGTSGKVLTINASSAGSQATLSKSTGTVSVSYCSIQDNNAAGGATWQSFTSNGNTNLGNNTGWDFGVVAVNSNFFLLMAA